MKIIIIILPRIQTSCCKGCLSKYFNLNFVFSHQIETNHKSQISDFGFSSFSDWSRCSMCGSASGTRSRVRECVNPQLGCDPSNGGTISVINGVMYETQVRPCLQTDECSVGKLLMFSAQHFLFHSLT